MRPRESDEDEFFARKAQDWIKQKTFSINEISNLVWRNYFIVTNIINMKGY